MSDELREELHKASIEAVALKLDWLVDEAGFYPVPDDIRREAIEAILPIIARERAAAKAEAFTEGADEASRQYAQLKPSSKNGLAKLLMRKMGEWLRNRASDAIRAAGTETGETS